MKRYINLFALFFLAILGYSSSAQQIGISVNTSSVWLNPGEETTIGINLNNPSATAFSAFQTSIALPEGVSIVNATVGYGFSAFEASYGEAVDGKVKVMAVELNSVEGSSSTTGQLLALTLKASDDIDPSYTKVTFSDTNFSTPSGKDIQATGSTSFEMLLNPAALKIGFTVSPESVTLNTGEETTVELTLSNPSAVAFSAFQTTLNLPAGVSVEKAVIGSEFDGFTAQVGTELDGKVTIMAVELNSVQGSTLTSGVLMTLTLKVAEGTDPDTSSLTFTDSRFSTPSGKDINATGEVSLEMTVNAPTTELTISPEDETIYEGGSATFTVTPTPANSNSEVVWTIDTDTLAEITAQDSKSATVKGIAFGTVMVTASVKDNEEITASATLIIKPIALTGLTVTAEDDNTELMDGETLQLTATYVPENATKPVNVTWSSSDEEVATVDAQSGLVTAHAKVGTATITATANNEAGTEVTGSINITVVATPASSITLNKTELTLLEGASEQLTATVSPETTTDKTVTWTSSAPEIASVSNDGTVTAVKYGTATITATCGSVSATCQVTVNPIALTGLTVTAADEKTQLMDGETVQLTATYAPENATKPVNVTWSSSDEDVATVDAQNGLVTAHAKIGTATITATANNEAGTEVTGTINITVVATPASSITLNKTELTLLEGASEQLTATVSPETTTDKTVTWTSSAPEISSVSNDGTVTAVKYGTATITATCGSVSATCQVTVNPIALTGLTVTAEDDNTELMDGETVQLTATYAPENATKPVNVTWSSSDEEVATVDAQSGLVTAHAKVGTATITATANNEAGTEVQGTINITVVATPPSSITLNKTELTLLEGASEQLTATVSPETTTDKTVTWTSSAPEIASVSDDGTVTAVKYGTAIITATCGSVSATCQVTVNPIALTGLTVTAEDDNTELMDGETVQLTATYAPENATKPVNVTWSSSDEDVATVDAQSGLVTAHAKVGTATITATANNEAGTEVTGTIEITVVATPATSVTLNKTELTLEEEKSEQLFATVGPDTTTDKTIVWTSSNPRVAEVSADGTVTALQVGTATITATCGDAFANCEVTVTQNSGVESILNVEGNINIYNLQGVLLFKDVSTDMLNELQKGVYIVTSNSGKSFKIVK